MGIQVPNMWAGVSNALHIFGNPRFVRLPPLVTVHFADKEIIWNKSQYISVWLTVKHSLAHAALTPHRRRGRTAQSHLPSRRQYTLQVSNYLNIHFWCNLSDLFFTLFIFAVRYSKCFTNYFVIYDSSIIIS